MLTDGEVRHETSLALRAPNTLAIRCDLRRIRDQPSRAPEISSATDVRTILGEGFEFAVRGTLASLRRDRALVCAAVGFPRFEAGSAAAAASRSDAAAGWLELYRELGAGMFDKAHGAWSVVIVDLARRSALAAVDRFGIRPLCYRAEAGTVAIASRADEVPGVDHDIDPQAIFDYVYHHVIPAPRTIFRGVARVEAGHRFAVTPEGIEVERHWRPAFTPRELPFGERRDDFLTALTSAVSDQLGSGSVGCYLSGGTDSSTVAGMVVRVTGTPVKTYSIGFDAAGYDEMHYARLAARHFGTDHHEYYVTPQDLIEHIPRVAEFYDQPFGNSSALPAFFCAKLAHDDGVARMLAGDGGDELFGGNSRYATDRVFSAYARLPEVIRRAVIEPIALASGTRALPFIRKGARYVEVARMPVPDRLQRYNLLMRIGPASVFTPEFLATIDAEEPRRRELATFEGIAAGAELDRTLAYEWKYILADNDLPKVTGTATLAGVDAAFPLLDDRLVDLSLTLPVELKVRGGKLRYFFKEALRGFLPDEIIAKKKHGFGLPFGVWVTREPALREAAREAIESLERRGLIRSEIRSDLFDRRIGEHAGYYGEMIWILMMLERWLERRAAAPRRAASS